MSGNCGQGEEALLRGTVLPGTGIREEGRSCVGGFLIDYKNLPGRPQFAAVLSDWDLSSPGNDDQFRPVLAEDTRQVDLAQMLGMQD